MSDPKPSADDRRGLAAVLAHAVRLKRRRARRLVWLGGDAAIGRRRARAVWQARDWRAPLWVGEPALDDAKAPPALPANKARTRLGQEHGLIVVDTAAGLDPDALGALGGTLTAGGLLLLITPEEWGQWPDADYRRIADHPHAWQALSAHYLARLARLLAHDAGAVCWPAEAPAARLPRISAAAETVPAADDSACRTADQARAVAKLTRLKRRRPLVITADRGRGKSAALGIACARLLARGVAHIAVTAPRPDAAAALFAHAAVEAGVRGEASRRLVVEGGGVLEFIAPDALSAAVEAGTLGGDGSYLMVDEAAAIPPALLGKWLAAFPRLAFATTVHGYEGSGRGFALRFRARLDEQTPGWQGLTLETPVRFAADDPLEATLNRLLLLKAAPPAPEDRDGGAVRWLERRALARDEPALEALFGLLVQSHYRTTPDDVRQLLDGPATRIGVLGAARAPEGVAVMRAEGGFETALAEQVARGERRPQGHLLAQSLAAHGGSREALTARWQRVTRIAVHPDLRRRGAGRRLLAAAEQAAREDGADLLGATFGAEAGLLAFWLAAGFVPVRVGISRDTATGEYALMMARKLTPRGEAVQGALSRRFARELPALLAFELDGFPPQALAALLATLPPSALDDEQEQAIEDVADARRDPRLARPALQALARAAARRPLDEAAQGACAELAGWAYQNRPLAGSRRQHTEALRRAAAVLWEALKADRAG
ncbi:GNAT family N-acetyltransferase [Halomonas garicola]|uniref:GNAT family N-acetyltransferase n=1 Tax=Halomonas garicola TaxID=1690008 RepID=UPI0028A278A3|nr:GNAT family N-acetyltransferase [Halomonas garicola]